MTPEEKKAAIAKAREEAMKKLKAQESPELAAASAEKPVSEMSEEEKKAAKAKAIAEAKAKAQAKLKGEEPAASTRSRLAK